MECKERNMNTIQVKLGQSSQASWPLYWKTLPFHVLCISSWMHRTVFKLLPRNQNHSNDRANHKCELALSGSHEPDRTKINVTLGFSSQLDLLVKPTPSLCLFWIQWENQIKSQSSPRAYFRQSFEKFSNQ